MRQVGRLMGTMGFIRTQARPSAQNKWMLSDIVSLRTNRVDGAGVRGRPGQPILSPQLEAFPHTPRPCHSGELD